MGVVTYHPAMTRCIDMIVVLVDLQKEFIIDGRAFYVPNNDEVIENCRMLLEAARAVRVPIAHFRRVRQGIHFNPCSPFTGWIDGFFPLPGEMIFERETLSCFDCHEFSQFISEISQPLIVLAGFDLEGRCLVTTIKARERDNMLWFIQDAIGGCPLGGLSSDTTRRAMIDLLCRHGEPLSTEEFIASINHKTATGRRFTI